MSQCRPARHTRGSRCSTPMSTRQRHRPVRLPRRDAGRRQRQWHIGRRGQPPQPAAATYTVVVQGWGVAGSTPFKLHTWLLGSSAAGNMAVTAPATATVGGTGTINLTFSGLAGGTKYLGSVAYGGGDGAEPDDRPGRPLTPADFGGCPRRSVPRSNSRLSFQLASGAGHRLALTRSAGQYAGHQPRSPAWYSRRRPAASTRMR